MSTKSDHAGGADGIQGSRLRRARQSDDGTDHERENCLHSASSCGWIGSGGSALARLQGPDVFDDLVDLRVTEGCAECGHCARLAILDAVANKIVVARRIHQLRPLASGPAAIGVTKTAGPCEQLLDVESVVRRRGGRLRLNQRGTD